jgi:RNA polymerase sigma-70 factor (ECF subfamily)
MATAQMDTVIRHLRRAVSRQDGAASTDGQLLASFIDQKDGAAFEALVRRHGSMVFGVCRRVVGNHHDAEDAFQATFLVLARKASSVRPRERVANWLHGVALRTAMKARTMTTKRRGREKPVTEMPEPEAPQQGQWRDLQPLLDQELNGLPEHYRLPLLLCDLEGKTIKAAAQQLNWPQGSLAGRLARGRKLLAKRLASRGVVLSAGSLAAVVSQHEVSAGVPTPLLSSTVKAATRIAVERAAVAGVVPARVAVLMEGALKSMILTKLTKAAVAGLVVLCLCGLGIGGRSLLTTRTMAQPPEARSDGTGPAPLRVEKTEAGARTEAARTDLDRLQGIWSVCWYERGGKRYKANKAGAEHEIVFMVDGKRACWQGKDSDEIQGGLYLDPTSKPKSFDFATSRGTMEGIYSLKGDTLELCYGWTQTESKRPGGFLTEKGSRHVHLGFKRIVGPEAFPYRLPDGTRAFPTIIERDTTPPPPPRQVAPTPKDSNNYDPGRTAPEGQEFAPRHPPRIAATVNGVAILADEVYAAAYLSLPDAHNLTALDRSRRITVVWRKTLDRVIERELIVQDAFTALNKDGNADLPKKLQELGANEFGRQWVETVKRSIGLTDDRQLRAFLSAQGTSLDGLRRQWERDFIAEEYLGSRLFGARDPEHARKERARIITQLKQHAVIEYAYGLTAPGSDE